MYTLKLTATIIMIHVLSLFHAGTGTFLQPNDHNPDNPAEALYATVTGQLSGFDCAVVGVLCPTTHRGADYTTGVFTNDEKFYFIVNIPQTFLQQYFRETVEVEGTVYEPYEHAVEPERIHIIEDGKRRLVYEEGYFIDENNRRATFQDGTFRNGRWMISDSQGE